MADRVIEVSDADSFAFTRRLAREEAMLVGGSSGMAAYAARQLAQELAAEGRAGSVSDRALLDALYTGSAKLTDRVEDHMSPPLPTVGSTEDARDAVTMLETSDAVLVQEDGKPIGVLTRQDLLAFLAGTRE